MNSKTEDIKKIDTDIGLKVKNLISDSKFNQKEISDKINITPASLSQMLSGKAPLPKARLDEILNLVPVDKKSLADIKSLLRRKALLQLAIDNIPEQILDDHLINQEHYGANVAYLVREIRSYKKQLQDYAEERANGTDKARLKELDSIIPGIHERIKKVNTEIKELTDQARKKYSNAEIVTDYSIFRKVPVITTASALTRADGYISIADSLDQLDEYVSFPGAEPTDVSVKIQGESMSPWYPEGTYVLISTTQWPITGDRVVVQTEDGEILFKVFIDEGTNVRLMSINRNNGKDMVISKRSNIRIYPIKMSLRNEQRLDEEMRSAGIKHFWEK